MPNTPDQPYGETERAPFIEELLAMNDPLNPRVRIGFSRRSYLLPPTTSEILKGRMKIGRDMTESDTEIVMGPVAREMVFPYWISVDGEIMLVTGAFPESAGIPQADPAHPNVDNTYKTYQHYGVERGNATNFFDAGKGCIKRKHRAGTPVTAVNFTGIYIHAKCMMIDDLFASIGSANMNRRGYHSDSETNVFFVPEPLRFTPSNPIAALRKELWAEVLNIPVEMGKNLLEDPIGASRLFDRDGNTGNRFIPYRAVSTMVKSVMNKLGDMNITTDSFDSLQTLKNSLSALALFTEGFDYDDLFFYISDPSSFSQNPHEP
jgi:phosphatidylserine/phosphatidylglycerophosphate/cardiolipin synthase-like enzyme